MRKFLIRAAATVAAVAAACAPCACGQGGEPPKGRYVADVKYEGGEAHGRVVYTPYGGCGEREYFNLYANAYRDGAVHPAVARAEIAAYKTGDEVYGGIEIQRVDVDGKEAEYELIGADLNVLSVKTDGGKSVGIDFCAAVPELKTRLGRSEKRVSLGEFLPVKCTEKDGKFYEAVYYPFGDPYCADAADYEVRLTVPSVYVAALSGTPTSTSVDGDYTTYAFSLSGARDLAAALGEDYVVAEQKTGDVTVAYYGGEDARKACALAADALAYFSGAFGAYAYDRFSLAEVPLGAGGAEFCGMAFISDGLTEEQKRLTIVHETAHEWWHAAVGNDECATPFLDEGLAEYSTFLYLAERGSDGEAQAYLDGARSAYKSFFDIVSVLSGNVDTAMDRGLDGFGSKYEYVNVVYNKSLVMFGEYEAAVGRKSAVGRLSRLYAGKKGGRMTYDDLKKFLGYGEFFDSYVRGKVLI